MSEPKSDTLMRVYLTVREMHALALAAEWVAAVEPWQELTSDAECATLRGAVAKLRAKAPPVATIPRPSTSDDWSFF